MLRQRSTSLVFAIVCSLLLLGACDTSVQPFDEDTGLYSIHGVLSISGNTNYIRIKNLNDPVPADSTQRLGATVTFTNLDTDASKTLEDTVVSFDGVYTHNFPVHEDLQPETSYRLTVERPDGNSTTAVATMPPITEVEVDAREPVKCQYGATFEFKNVPDSRFIEISIGVPYNEQFRWTRRDVDIQSGFRAYKAVEKWLPREITSTVDSTRWCEYMDEDHLRIAYTHYGSDWPADSLRTDPVASNVENGLGLFGGVHRDTFRVKVDTSSIP